MRRVGLVLFLWLASATAAFAQGPTALTPADVRYLTTLGQSQRELAANRPTPQELEKLHQLINDPAARPKAREEAVWRLLDHIQARFLWCSEHPADKDCSAATAASAQ